MKRTLFAIAAIGFSLMLARNVRADAAAVQNYVDQAAELVGKGSQFFDDAKGKLDLADASMDDVPETDKPALQAKIDALKGKIETAAGAQDKARIERDVKDLLEQLEGLVGNLVAWPGKAAELTAILDDPKTTAALGEPAVTAFRKQFATMMKVHQSKAFKEQYATAKEQVDQLEKDWTERKASLAAAGATEQSRNDAVIDTMRDLEQVERFFKELPADNADVKTLRARVDRIKTEQVAAAGEAGSTTEIERINRFFEQSGDDFTGMDAETAAPAWADFRAGTGDAREFNAPKTVAYIRQVSYFLGNLEKEEGYLATKDDPKVKAMVRDINAKLAAARGKIAGFANKLLDEVEKEKVTAKNVSDVAQLQYMVVNALGADSTDGKPLIARAEKMQQDFRAAGDKAEADTMSYYKSMTEQADKAWPSMMAKFDVAEGFDPNDAGAMKGKYIKIVSNNLMGWRFKHGDFPYATRINGLPVAGKYDPTVKAALAEVEARLGRAIGDNDNDGKWTAIARVEGGTGRLIELVKSSGDVTVDGANVGTVEGTHEVPVDAPIVTIVALKAGPVAVAEGQGAVKEDGAVGAPGAIPAAGGGALQTGRRGISWFGILSGLIALLVGAACLMKAKFAPLATNTNAVKFSEKVGGQNLAYLGLVGIVLGAIGVILNVIALASALFAALIGLVASLAMVIAGGVASRDLLEPRGLLPANIGSILSKYAIPSGVSCAVLGVITIIVSLY